MKKDKLLFKKILLLVIGFFVLAAVGGGFWLFKKGQIRLVYNPPAKTVSLPSATASKSEATYPEVSEVTQQMSFEQLKHYFQELANKKGGRYAFEVLKRIQPGPNIDMHLMGHVVGDILYKQEGLNGITACDNDFRNACSHAIVVGLFYDKGDGALADIASACRKAPGGIGAYTMCFHGLGHGILAYEGYTMEKAAEMCKKTGTAQYHFQESTQCISGTVMEIIEGGDHDKQLWTEQRKKYLDPKKPIALCQNAFIPDDSRFLCYEYLTPYLFEAAGADRGNPKAEDFKKAFTFCNAISTANQRDRNACFGGFGKEFDGLVQSRDIRKDSFTKISDSSLQQIYTWCQLANDKVGTAACIVDAMNSLYWGGENDRSVAVRYCGQIPESDNYNRTSCYLNLINAVSYYIKDADYRSAFCSELPEKYKGQCQDKLINNTAGGTK